MLGRMLHDPDHVESRVPELAGLDLLDMEVSFAREKETAQASGVVDASGWLASSNGILVDGYEIHAGQNQFGEKVLSWLRIGNRVDGVMNERGNVLGSYLHGLFDDGQLFAAIAAHIRKEKGIDTETQVPMTLDEYREQRDLPVAGHRSARNFLHHCIYSVKAVCHGCCLLLLLYYIKSDCQYP